MSVLLNYRQRLASIEGNNDRDFVFLYEAFIRELSAFGIDEFSHLGGSIFLEYSTFYKSCQKRYLAIKEYESANSLLELGNEGNYSLRDLLLFQFGKDSYSRVRDLSDRIDFTQIKRLVMVGCGSLPSTLFWLYDHYPAIDYIGLDINANCVALASKVINALNISKVHILNHDGCEFDFSGFDCIFIANQVTPKTRVLDRIAKTSDISAQVVVRNPTFTGKLLAECVRNILPSEFSIEYEGNESQTFLSMNLFLIRNQT